MENAGISIQRLEHTANSDGVFFFELFGQAYKRAKTTARCPACCWQNIQSAQKGTIEPSKKSKRAIKRSIFNLEGHLRGLSLLGGFQVVFFDFREISSWLGFAK